MNLLRRDRRTSSFCLTPRAGRLISITMLDWIGNFRIHRERELYSPVGLVEEDDIHLNRVHIRNVLHFRENLGLIFALFGLDEIEHALAEIGELIQRGSEFDCDGDSFGETTTTAHIEDEEGVEERVGGLYDVAFELLELRVPIGVSASPTKYLNISYMSAISLTKNVSLVPRPVL